MTIIDAPISDERLAEIKAEAGLSFDHFIELYAFEVRSLIARVEEAEGGWRDIASAPRDGRMALVYRPLARNSGDEPVAIKRLIEGNAFCWATTVPEGAEPFNPTDGSCHVTHWKPLDLPPPSPPES